MQMYKTLNIQNTLATKLELGCSIQEHSIKKY